MLALALLLFSQGCLFGGSSNGESEAADSADSEGKPAAKTPAVAAGTETDANEEGDSSYRVSLRGSILGSVTDNEITDALPDTLEPRLVPQFIRRGKYLTIASGCGSCHGLRPGDPSSPLAGGQIIKDRFGEVRAANITPAKQGGIGEWTIRDIGSAIRASLGKGEHPLSIEAHQAYRWISDIDTIAIAVYLKSTPPLRHDIDRRELGTFERSSWGLVSRHQEVHGYVPSPATSNPLEYGRYLVQHVGACAVCHTPEGGVFSDGELLAGRELDENHAIFPRGGPDLRGKSGELKKWSKDDLIAYLSTGSRPSGNKADGKLCPWPFFRYLSDKDKQAISAYLKQL